MKKLTAKQQRFCTEYLIDCNATQAAIRSGYSEKTAGRIGSRLLKDNNVKIFIESKLEEIQGERVADAKEVMEYLTNVLRGTTKAEIVVVEGEGEGRSAAKKIRKAPDEKEKLKAAELLGKRYNIFKENLKVSGAVPIVITGDDKLDE